MTDKIISMADKLCDGTLQSPEQALQNAINYIGKKGSFKEGKKLLILCVDDNNKQYQVNWVQAGMTMSECLALCEVAKTLFLTEMNYIS